MKRGSGVALQKFKDAHLADAKVFTLKEGLSWQIGDRIRLSVAEKRIDLLVDAAEIARRLAGFVPPPAPERGYKALYRRTVLQAQDGCDFDFLTGLREP